LYPGGISDKQGNRYEELWTILHFLRVLRGDHQALTVEKLGKENDGFEFHIEGNDGKQQWLQSKINARGGNWTPNALKSAGVLDAFQTRLRNPDCVCLFVSQDGTNLLREACNDARVAGKLEAFKDNASEDRTLALETFAGSLTGENAESIAFDHMSRCYFENASMAFLESTIVDLTNFLFRSPEHAKDLAAGFLAESINRRVTSEDARNWARNTDVLGLRPELDPTAFQRLEEANAAYLASHSTRRFGQNELDRGHASKVLEQLEKGTSLIVVSGTAGSGKTVAVRQLLSQAVLAGVHSLALRLDKRLDASTPQELGEVNGLPESPVAFLARLAQGARSVLIIDQIDAVSEMSGRNASVRDALFATLRQAALHPNLHCVLVCRDYDLDGDDQFRALLGRNPTTNESRDTERVQIEPLDWESEVAPLLAAHGFGEVMTQSQKSLLSSPLNLSLYLSIEKNDFRPDTQAELFDTLLDQIQKKNPAMALTEGLQAMVDWMNERHQLRCPDFVLRPFAGLKDWLASEGLVVADGRALLFMHESLFDHLFAAAFLQQGRTLVDFLAESEQSLFRRTQVRQILQQARSFDWAWYLINLREILSSPDIRPHIKLAVAKWLSQLPDPTTDEYEIVLSTDNPKVFFSTVVSNAFLNEPHWMPMLVERGFIQDALTSDVAHRSNHMSWWFARNAGHYPEIAADVMRGWWQEDDARTDALVDWFGLVDRKGGDATLAQLLVDVLAARPKQLFQGGRDRIGMLLVGWVEGVPEGVDLILAELMACWFEANPKSHPFAFDAVKELDLHHFGQLAEKDPCAFLKGMMPTILKTLEVLEKSDDPADKWRFSSRYKNDLDDLLTIIFSAFCALAENKPEVCEELLIQFEPCRHQVVTHLWLVCLARAPIQLAKYLDHIGKCDTLLTCGYHGAEHIAFSKAAKALVESGACMAEQVEAVFLNSKSEHRRAAQYLARAREENDDRAVYKSWAIESLRETGKTEWAIMSMMGSENLSERGKDTFQQLQRKFSDLLPPEPRTSRVRQVVSPLSKTATEAMTDDQWLSAILKYDSDNWRGEETENTVKGGARELAHMLFEIAKSDPIRFLSFAIRIPEDAHSSYLTSCIEGVCHAEEINVDLAVPLVLELYDTRRDMCGRQLCELASRHPDFARDEAVLRMILWYAEHGEGPHSGEDDLEQARERVIKHDQIVDSGMGLVVSGDVHTKTCAWVAIMRALWLEPPRLDIVWPVLSEAVDVEPSLTVRMRMLEVFGPLYNLNRTYFDEALQRLMTARGADDNGQELYPLAGYTGFDLARFISYNNPESARRFIERMIASGDDLLDHVGSWWAMVHSLNHELDTAWIETIKSRSPQHLRLWVELLSQCAATTEFRNFAIDELGAYFENEDEEIRKTASGVFRRIKPAEFRHFKDLANRFVPSRALLDGSFGFFHLLEEAIGEVSELVLRAAEVLINDIAAKGDHMGSRGLDLHQLQDLLRLEYLASEGHVERRKRILDLIDEMIEFRLYGTDELLKLGDK